MFTLKPFHYYSPKNMKKSIIVSIFVSYLYKLKGYKTKKKMTGSNDR